MLGHNVNHLRNHNLYTARSRNVFVNVVFFFLVALVVINERSERPRAGLKASYWVQREGVSTFLLLESAMAQKDIKHLTEHDTKANKLCVLIASTKYVKIQRKKFATLCVLLSTSWGFIHHNIETLHCIWNQSLLKRMPLRRRFSMTI